MTDVARLAEVAARYDDGGGEGEALLAATLRRLEWRRRRGGKECANCQTFLPVSRFGPRTDATDGLRSWCRSCETRRKKVRLDA